LPPLRARPRPGALHVRRARHRHAARPGAREPRVAARQPDLRGRTRAVAVHHGFPARRTHATRQRRHASAVLGIRHAPRKGRTMSNDFRLLMIGAMYENGGNTTHRLLDGHRELFVYPFESQIGTRWVNDHLASMFPVKYRWPVFALDATPAEDFHAIID